MGNVNIRKADINDLDQIFQLIKDVYTDMEYKDWFSISKNIKTYAKFIKCGYSLVACDNDKIIGCFLTYITPEDELFDKLNYNDNDKKQTVIMETCVVLNQYRGLGLQKRMLLEIENMIKELNAKRFICTVHPDNKYSLNNMVSNGYEVKMKTLLYGGLDRYILEKLM